MEKLKSFINSYKSQAKLLILKTGMAFATWIFMMNIPLYAHLKFYLLTFFLISISACSDSDDNSANDSELSDFLNELGGDGEIEIEIIGGGDDGGDDGGVDGGVDGGDTGPTNLSQFLELWQASNAVLNENTNCNDFSFSIDVINDELLISPRTITCGAETIGFGAISGLTVQNDSMILYEGQQVGEISETNLTIVDTQSEGGVTCSFSFSITKVDTIYSYTESISCVGAFVINDSVTADLTPEAS